MRFNITINQQKCMDLGVNLNEGAMLDLFNQLSSWATEVVIDGKVFYHLSRNKVIDELPFFYRKPDTVYRAFRNLQDLKLVDYVKQNGKDYVRLTAKGKGYNKLGNKSENGVNSEMNPSKLGNKSEFENGLNIHDYQLFNYGNSEINPTYNIYNYTRDNFIIENIAKIKVENRLVFDAFFNGPTYYENLSRKLQLLKTKLKFQNDVVPIILRWLSNAYASGGLNFHISRLKQNCMLYVEACVKKEQEKVIILNANDGKYLGNAI